MDVAVCRKGTEPRQRVVLVEYKRCPYISTDNFEWALKDEDEVQDTLKALKDEGIKSIMKAGLDDYIFLKQATTYYVQGRCNYVGLCDHESLILIRYLGGGDLKSAKVTVVPRRWFRKALLGFCLEACQGL